MRTKAIPLFIVITAIISLSSFAQEYKSFQIENIATEAVWPAVYKAFQELKLPKPAVNINAGTGETSYYYFTALMIKNRARFRVEYAAGTLTISLFGRQYMTDKGWADNMMPMTKKQASNILDPIKDRIVELTKDKPFTAPSQLAQGKPETGKSTGKEIKKAGIYEDFVIVRTDDPEMDLLAVHKNGNIIGFDLSDDKKVVRALVFKENKDAEPVTVLFNVGGSPRGMVTDKYAFHIIPDGESVAELAVSDLQGNLLSSTQIKLNTALPATEDMPDENPGQGHGPSDVLVITMPVMGNLAEYLGYASTVLQGVACASAVASGVGIILAAPACGSLLLDLTLRVLPKENFVYDELEVVQTIFSLASFSSPVSKIEIAGTLVGGLKDAVGSAENLLNKYFPEPTITIEGPSIIKIGIENEINTSSDHGAVTLYAKANFPDTPITWNIKTDRQGKENALYFFPPFEKNNEKYRENYSGVILMGRENYDYDLMNADGQIIETGIVIEAKQLIEGKEVSAQKKIDIYNPKYFYFPYPDCLELLELKLISPEEYDKCSDQADKCKGELWDNGYNIVENDPKLISLILDEHLLSASGLTDPNQSIDSKQLNFTRKLWKKDGSPYPPEEAGQLREFVKPAPCMGNWYGLGDKQTIIILAHEAMDKMQVNQEKIKTLQKAAELILTQSQNANDPKFLKIAEDINMLETSSKAIRAEYADRINKIAEKGTIQIASKKSDTAKYYDVTGVHVVGAHWQRKSLSILIKVDIVKRPIPKIVNEEQFYETAFDLSFQYIDSNEKIIEKGTVLFTQFALFLETFEKTELIDFHSSSPALSKKPSADGLDNFRKD